LGRDDAAATIARLGPIRACARPLAILSALWADHMPTSPSPAALMLCGRSFVGDKHLFFSSCFASPPVVLDIADFPVFSCLVCQFGHRIALAHCCYLPVDRSWILQGFIGRRAARDDETGVLAAIRGPATSGKICLPQMRARPRSAAFFALVLLGRVVFARIVTTEGKPSFLAVSGCSGFHGYGMSWRSRWTSMLRGGCCFCRCATLSRGLKVGGV